MNIVQVHNKTLFYLDSERSPRFNDQQVNKAINSAVMDIVNSRYENIKKPAKDREYAFQTSQRLRDELYTLVRYSAGLTATSDTIPVAQFPADYMYLIILEANISGKSINTIPITYDEFNVIQQNPYFRPSISWPERVYRIESVDGIKVIWGDRGRLLNANVYYISKPLKVNIGTEVNDPFGTHFSKADDDEVIAFIPSVIRLYDESWVFMEDLSLEEEELYVIGTNSESYSQLVSGIVYYNSINTDLPENLHEELCRTAAKILSGNVENYNREQSLEKDIKQQ